MSCCEHALLHLGTLPASVLSDFSLDFVKRCRASFTIMTSTWYRQGEHPIDEDLNGAILCYDQTRFLNLRLKGSESEFSRMSRDCKEIDTAHALA